MNMHNDFIKSALDARLSGLTPSPDMRERVWQALEEDRKLRHIGETPRRRPHLGRTLLVAAVFVLALSATALGVYQRTVKDAVMEDMPSARYTAGGEYVLQSENRLSLNGFADSPEYQAYVEWESYLAQWRDSHANLGMDDTKHDTPDNYAYLYDAYFPEQGSKLDEIMEAYGLTLHTDRFDFVNRQQLSRALGTDELLSGEEYTVKGDYIYDDGSFKMFGTTTIDGMDPWDDWFEIYAAVKGSFAMLSQSAPEGEEWSYTTPAGIEIAMADAGFMDRIYIVAELEGCYVSAYIDTADRAIAQDFAQSINWTALNDLFATEKSRQAAAQAVAAFAADPSEASAEPEQGNMDAAAEEAALLAKQDETLQRVLATLGDFSVTADGYTCTTTNGLEDEQPGNGICNRVVTKFYTRSDGFQFTLSYEQTRLLADDSVTIRKEDFRGRMATYEAEVNSAGGDSYLRELTINGCDGYLAYVQHDGEADGDFRLLWLDTDNGLTFNLSPITVIQTCTAEELIALAESVAPAK